MPHDSEGRVIEVGDRVVAYGIVKEIYGGEDYCNVQINLDAPENFDPEQEHMRDVTTNTRLFTIVEE